MIGDIRNQKPETRKALALSALCLLLSDLPLLAAPEAGHTAAPPAAAGPSAKQIKEGEMEEVIKGVSKDKMTVGKLDPPAAFNLEDIQNFPEERLHPVLNNPITFDEGRDFSSLMDSQEERIIHPWLPEISRAPFLSMRTAIDKPAKDWTFSVIDQGGTPVAMQEGRGSPPDLFSWNGQDKERGSVAVDTVYIPQLATTDKEGYRHTYMGQPIQFASLLIKEKGRTVVELSSKRLFQEKKADLTKEAYVLLDKLCDFLREEARFPIGIQAYDTDLDLGRARLKTLARALSDKLSIPENMITTLEPANAEKRGLAIAFILNSTPGGSQ